MSARTDIADLQAQVRRLSTVTAVHTSDYGRDPSGLMELGLGQPTDPWQNHVLDERARDQLLLCCRQSGKSTTVAAKAVHVATYEPGSTVLMIGPSLRQAQELHHKCTFLHRIAGEPVAIENLSALRMELANRSRIIALPATEATIRGYSGPRLILIDEAAWVPDSLFHALTPMLAVSGGQLIAMSTPGGARGWFYNEWESGGDDYARVKITANECPRITPEFLARETRRMPDSIFRSEYFCEFTDAIDSVFRFSDIIAAFTPELQPQFTQLAA